MQSWSSVSYTHLDVYKRQSCVLSAAGLAAAIAVNAGNTAITAVYGALMVLWGTAFYAAYRTVSYTHLKIPYMNYSEYIPDKARTFVVMPVIVSSKEQCVEFCNRMHKHYLANRQPNLYFALLADFADADAKRCV